MGTFRTRRAFPVPAGTPKCSIEVMRIRSGNGSHPGGPPFTRSHAQVVAVRLHRPGTSDSSRNQGALQRRTDRSRDGLAHDAWDESHHRASGRRSRGRPPLRRPASPWVRCSTRRRRTGRWRRSPRRRGPRSCGALPPEHRRRTGTRLAKASVGGAALRLSRAAVPAAAAPIPPWTTFRPSRCQTTLDADQRPPCRCRPEPALTSLASTIAAERRCG